MNKHELVKNITGELGQVMTEYEKEYPEEVGFVVILASLITFCGMSYMILREYEKEEGHEKLKASIVQKIKECLDRI